jgi:hypothetical protein
MYTEALHAYSGIAIAALELQLNDFLKLYGHTSIGRFLWRPRPTPRDLFVSIQRSNEQGDRSTSGGLLLQAIAQG